MWEVYTKEAKQDSPSLHIKSPLEPWFPVCRTQSGTEVGAGKEIITISEVLWINNSLGSPKFQWLNASLALCILPLISPIQTPLRDSDVYL